MAAALSFGRFVWDMFDSEPEDVRKESAPPMIEDQLFDGPLTFGTLDWALFCESEVALATTRPKDTLRFASPDALLSYEVRSKFLDETSELVQLLLAIKYQIAAEFDVQMPNEGESAWWIELSNFIGGDRAATRANTQAIATRLHGRQVRVTPELFRFIGHNVRPNALILDMSQLWPDMPDYMHDKGYPPRINVAFLTNRAQLTGDYQSRVSQIVADVLQAFKAM